VYTLTYSLTLSFSYHNLNGSTRPVLIKTSHSHGSGQIVLHNNFRSQWHQNLHPLSTMLSVNYLYVDAHSIANMCTFSCVKFQLLLSLFGCKSEKQFTSCKYHGNSRLQNKWHHMLGPTQGLSSWWLRNQLSPNSNTPQMLDRIKITSVVAISDAMYTQTEYKSVS